jgi:hypothetical protein
MQTAIEVFRISAARAKHLGGLHSAISSFTTPALDPSDLLRAQIVLTVSALDYFIHEITAKGMIEIYNGHRAPTDAFRRYKTTADLLIGSSAGNSSAFEVEIRERHSYLSFQQPDKIADAIRNIYSDALWKNVAAKLSATEEDVKKHLRLIVDRRNKIAHEADSDPSYPGQRWPITKMIADDALTFIESVVEAIYYLVK